MPSKPPNPCEKTKEVFARILLESGHGDGRHRNAERFREETGMSKGMFRCYMNGLTSLKLSKIAELEQKLNIKVI